MHCHVQSGAQQGMMQRSALVSSTPPFPKRQSDSEDGAYKDVMPNPIREWKPRGAGQEQLAASAVWHLLEHMTTDKGTAKDKWPRLLPVMLDILLDSAKA